MPPEIDVPVWAVPVLITVIGSLGGVLVALVNRRPNQQNALLEAMAKNREADSKENQRLDMKLDQVLRQAPHRAGVLHGMGRLARRWHA